jgi:hypothetical protein
MVTDCHVDHADMMVYSLEKKPHESCGYVRQHNHSGNESFPVTYASRWRSLRVEKFGQTRRKV